MNREQLYSLIGKTEEYCEKLCEETGWYCRAISIDGIRYASGADMNSERINLSIKMD
jgi:hypothetical protein